MEDYDVFNEMQDIKEVVLIIEDDEKFIINNLLNSNIEVMPIRYSYDLSCFSSEYIELTKSLFTYYYTEENSYDNELLRLKKHFIHYQRKTNIAYIPNKPKYQNLIKMLNELDVICISNKEKLIDIINNKKLILIDSDGTLRKSDGTITDRTLKAIYKNRLIGNKVVICTARPRYHTIEVMKSAHASEIVISSNGSEVYDVKNKKVLFNSFVDKDEVYNLIELAYLNDLRLVLALEDYDYVTKILRNDNQKLLNRNSYKEELENKNIKQCMFIDSKLDLLNKVKEEILKNKKLRIVDEKNINDSYYEDWFCIGDVNSSKGSALLFLSDYLNIKQKNTIAIGNDKNDIPMFEVSGISVAVGNASDEIKNMVDHVTLSNDEDGVAIFLESLLDE